MKIFEVIFLSLLVISCQTDAQEIVSDSTSVEEIEELIKKEYSENYSLSQLITEHGILKDKLRILIDKSDYTLQVLNADTVLISYPAVFGFNPVDDKKMEGDGATPEGTFKIRSKYPHKSWTYFIWFDYPNDSSKEKFDQRKADGEIPNDAQIGGEVGIHGVPEGYDSAIDQKNNWTLGCISLKTAHIRDLYQSISDKTTIKIQQ